MSQLPKRRELELKEKGNQFYSANMFEEAIACYSEAIQINRFNTILYTNRALAELKLKRFDNVASDCRKALRLDPMLVKGHHILGRALCEIGLLDEGLRHLSHAVNLAKEQCLYYLGEKNKAFQKLAQMVEFWRNRRFTVHEEKRVQEEIELQMYLSRLISEDMERQVRILKDEESDKKEQADKIASVEQYSTKSLIELNNVFAKVDDARRNRVVPDYLCGKISLEILRDPVITPSGITYERRYLEDHLDRLGHYDPTTRCELKPEQLIPNYAIKEAVDTFLAENEWAIDL